MQSATAVISFLASRLPTLRPLTARLGMAWLLVAAILAHAALPTGSALQRGAGSAFSVTTSEVTIIPKRDKVRQRVETEQAGDPAANALTVIVAPVAPKTAYVLLGAAPGHFPPAAVPRNQHALRHFQARAPPSTLSATA